MSYDIGPQIGIDGEKEFTQSLKTINSQIKTLQSEMKAAVTSMAGMDDAEDSVSKQTDILGRSIDATKQKISLISSQYERAKSTLDGLGAELENAKKEFGDNSAEASKAQSAYNRQAQAVNRLGTELNNATADLNKMQSELNSLRTASDKAADAVEDIGEEAVSAGNKMTGLFSSSFSSGAFIGAVSSGIDALISGITSLVDSASEYTRIMGTLETSSQKAGYTAEETSATYRQLYTVLGDTQTAATAAANLQALGLEQSKLTKLTDMAIGAWATYGDSIPIDSLAESINETVRAGQVTGTFADALNWAGTSEDEFNERLAAAGSESERVNLVMEELAKQGLGDTAEAWRENNKALVEYRAATESFNEAMAGIAEMVMPIITTLQGGLASLISSLLEFVTIGQTQGIGQMLESINASLAENLPIMIQQGISALTNFIGGISTMLPQVLTTAISIISTLVQGIISQIPNIIDSSIQAITSFLNELTAHMPEILNKGVEILGSLIDGIIGAIPSLVSALPQVISAIVSFVIENLPTIFSAGWDILVEIGKGIIDAIATLPDTISEVVTAIVDGFADAVDSFLGIGEDIIDGIWDGISGSIDWLKGKIKGFGKSITGWFKGVLGIHSPSRVMRDEVGMPIAEGIAEGISRGEREVINTAEKLNDALIAEEERLVKRLEDTSLDEATKTGLNDALTNLRSFKTEYQSALQSIQQAQETFADKIKDYGTLIQQIGSGEWSSYRITSATELQKQTDIILEYGKALEELQAKGTPDSLMSEISEMSIEDGLNFARTLLKYEDDTYREYISAWEEKQKAAEEVARKFYQDDLEALSKEYVDKLPEELDGIKDSMYNLGVESAGSFSSAFIAQYNEIKNAISSTVKSAVSSTVSAALSDVQARAAAAVDRATSSDLYKASAGMVNGITSAGAASSQQVIIPVNIDGKQVAQVTYDPLKGIAKQRGEAYG